MPRGLQSLAYFAGIALLGAFVVFQVGRWQQRHPEYRAQKSGTSAHPGAAPSRSRRVVIRSLAILMALVFSKYFYMAALGNYYTFYLMDRFALPATTARS